MFATLLLFPDGSDGKESARNVGDLGSIPGSGRSLGKGNGNPLQYSCLENSVDRGYTPWGLRESDMVGHDWATNTVTFHFLLHSYNSLRQKKKSLFSLRVISFHGASASECHGVWESMFEFWLSYLTSFSSLIILASTSKKIMLPCSCSWVESIPFSPLSVMLSVNVFAYAHHYEDFLKINLKTFLLANYESIFLIFRESPLTTTKPKSTVRKFKEV